MKHLQHSNETEYKQRQDALAKVKEEVAHLKKQTIYTEANVMMFTKIKNTKAELIEKEKKLVGLQSELKGLRNVKNNQNTELEKQTVTKNFPKKIKDIMDEIKEIKKKEIYINEQLKVIEETKTVNFEEIIALEDQIRAVKERRKREAQFRPVKGGPLNLQVVTED